MNTDKLLQNRLMGRTIRILSRAMDFRSAKQRIISGNLANIDTPGFKPKELRFDQVLQRAADKTGISLKTTNPGHFSHASDVAKGNFSIQTRDMGPKGSNQLNLDMEMAKMMRNNLLYEASARLLTKKFRALKTAIESGRR